MSYRTFSKLSAALLITVVCMGTFTNLLPAADWNVDGGGDWSIPGNWTGSGTIPPNGVDEVANFSRDTPDGTNNDWLITNVSGTIGTLLLEDTGPSDNSGWQPNSGSLTFDVSSGRALINFRESMSEINIPLTLNDDLDITYTYTTRNHRANLNRTISSGTGLTTHVDINRYNPFGTGNYGRVVLEGTNTFNGDVTVHNAMLQLYHGKAIPDTSDVTIAGGASMRLLYNDAESINGLYGSGYAQVWSGSATDNATLDVGAGGGDGDFSGVIREEGTTGYTLSLKKSGAGTQILRGANTYHGTTTVSAGTLVVANDAALGNATSPVQLADSNTGSEDVALLISGVHTISRDINVSSDGTGTVTIGSDTPDTSVHFITGDITMGRSIQLKGVGANRTTFLGDISGTGAVTMIGPNRVTFEGENTYSGDTIVTAGTFQFGYPGSSRSHVPDTSNVTVQAGANMLLYGVTEAINGLNGDGRVAPVAAHATLNVGAGGGDGTFNGSLEDGGSYLMTLVKSGTGTQTLSGANTYSGTTTVSAGALALGHANALGSSSSAVELADANTGSNDVALMISGASVYINRDINVNNLGSGTVTIGSNTVEGGSGDYVVFRGDITMGRTLHLQGMNIDRTTFDGDFSGTGDLYIDGPRRLTFTGNNTYNGNTYITAGTMQCQLGHAIPDASDVTVAGGATLRIWDTSEAINGLNGAGYVQIGNSTRTLTVGAADGGGTFSGTLCNEGSGVLSLLKAGTATQILTGASTYTGPTTVAGGTLQVDGSLGNTTVTVQSGASLAGSGSIDGSVIVDADGFLLPGTSIGTLTVDGDVTTSGTYLAEINGDTLDADLVSVTSGTFYAGGKLEVQLLAGTVDAGDVFNLIDGTISGQFDEIILPPITPGLIWRTSRLYTAGEIFVNVPEPSALLLAALGLVGLGLYRRRRRQPAI